MNKHIIKVAVKKAMQSQCCYRISALGFNKNGEILGSATNKHGKNFKGGGVHAERELIRRYGKSIHTILLCRCGGGGDILPIQCCETCQKIVDRMGIKVLTVSENNK